MEYSKVIHPGTHLPGVDLWKYIMAIGVVAIHVGAISSPDSTYPLLIKWFIRSAVPFFFISSGFLIRREISITNIENRQRFLLGKAKKIVRIYLLWLFIYFPIAIIWLISHNTPPIKIVTTILTSILIYGELPYAWPLWYLYSLFLMIFGLAITDHSKAFRILLIGVVGAFYILPFCFNYYGTDGNMINLWRKISIFLPIRVIGGGIYFLFGIFIYTWYRKIANILSILTLLSLSLISFAYNIPGFEIWSGGGIFLFATTLASIPKRDSWSLRVQSIWIYYLHMFVIYCLVTIAEKMKIELLLWPSFVISVFPSILIAFLLTQMQKKPQYKFLKFFT